MVKVEDILQEFSEKLPKFSDGRIDYSSSDKAPVLTCFVKYQDKILLLKRSGKVRVYKGLWNTVAGYIDELCSVGNKALAELKEELGITEDMIRQMKQGTPYEFYDKDVRKTWIIFPLLADLKKKLAIKLDWEHTEFKWIKPDQINEYSIVPNLDVTLKKVL